MSTQFDPYYTWLGIPPEDQPPDHYRLLGIRRFENNPEVISNALGQRLVHIRSFQASERRSAAEQLLRELAEVGECFNHADRKGAYDRELRQKDAPKLGRTQSSAQFSKPAALHKSAPIPAAPISTPSSAPFPASTMPIAGSNTAVVPTPAIAHPAIPAIPIPQQPMHAPGSGARFMGAPEPIPVPHAAPGMPIVITKPAAGPPPPIPASGGVAWQPLAIVAGAGALFVMLGGVALVAVLFGLGVFSSKPNQPKDNKVALKQKENVKPQPPIQIKPPPKENEPTKPIVKPEIKPEVKPEVKPPEPPPVTNVSLPPVSANTSEPLDLLKDFDRTKQVNKGGTVRKVAGGWQTGTSGLDQLIFHVPDLPPEYMVETVVTRQRATRLGADDGVVQGLVVGDQQCMVTVDGFNPKGMRTALDLIDGKRAGASSDKDECEHRGQLLSTRQDTTLQYYVFKDRLAVVCNGQTVLDWTGGMNRLSLFPMFKTTDPKALFWGTWQGSFVLKKFEVRAIGPDGGPPPPAILAASSGPKTPNEKPTPGGNSPSPNLKPPSVTVAKMAIPAQDDRKGAQQLIKEKYKSEFAKAAQKPDDKVTLGDELLKMAKDEKDPARLYSLLDEARTLKLEAADVEGAMLVIDKMIARFELDPWDAKSSSLKLAAPNAKAPKARKELASYGYMVAQGAMAAGKFESAEIAANLAKDAADKVGDAVIRKDALELRIAADAAKKQQASAQAAYNTLQNQPDEVDANDTWGRFVCLTKRDWKDGLPYLAKGKDGALKMAAAQDAGQPAEATDQIALADKWWQAAEEIKDEKSREKDSLKLRAREWYQRALPNATGLDRGAAQRRIDETAALFAKNTISTDLGGPKIPGAAPGAFGRIWADKNDMRLFVKYDIGAPISNQDVLNKLADKGKNGRLIHIELSGRIHLPEETEIVIDNSAEGDVGTKTAIGLNGKEITQKMVGRKKPEPQKKTLPKGEHQFAWMIEGSNLDKCTLTIKNADASAPPLYIYYDPVIQHSFTNPKYPVTGEIKFSKESDSP